MQRKHILKSIRQHIDAEENDEAESLIRELLGRGEEDYMLYVFAAVVRSKKGDIASAIHFYRESIRIDENKMIGWQGIAKLYETEQLPADDFVLNVFDKLIILCSETPEKRQLYVRMRDRALLDLGRYSTLLQEEHFSDDIELCKLVLRTIVTPERIYDDMEHALCEKCVAKMETEVELDNELASRCALFRASFANSFNELRNLLINEASRFGGLIIQGWHLNLFHSLIAASLLYEREVDTTMCDLLLSNPERDHFGALIELIRNEQFDSAFNLLLMLNVQQLSWPLCGLGIVVCLRQEQYERVLKLADMALSIRKHPAVESMTREGLLTAKAEALEGIGDESALNALHQLLSSEHFDNAIWNFFIVLNVADSDCTDENFLKTLDEAHIAEDEKYCWLASRASKRGNLCEAKQNAAKAIGRVTNSWRVMLLLAEALIRIHPNDLNATALLLKVVKLRGPSSRIYYRLAENLADRSPSKALSCLDMATKIRPYHLGVAQLRDKLLGLEGRKHEQLSNVKRFLAVQPRCIWALKRLALLKLQLNMDDEAVEDLQAALRLDRDDLVLLNALGMAYGRRGNFESAIRTYRSLLELSPEDTDARMQLLQMYRVCGQLDEAVEQCDMLHERMHASQCLLVLHVDVLMRMAHRESSSAKRITLLNRLFELISTRAQGGEHSLALLKLIGDSLTLVATFGEQVLGKLSFPKVWSIGSREDALKIAADAYFAVTKLRPSAESWNDLGVTFLRRSRLSGDKLMANRALVSFKHALAMSKCKQVESVIWTNMAQAVLLDGSPLSSLHCVKAALLLNSNNALAWSLLALLLINFGKYESSQRALDMAVKEDANVAETWSLQALLKQRVKHPSAVDLFEQSISMKPTKLAIEWFTLHTVRSILYHNDRIKHTNMFDSYTLHDFVEMSNVDDTLLFFVALLAEHMGCFALALHCIGLCGSFPNDHLHNIHQQRITIRTQCGKVDDCVEPLKKLAHLYDFKTDQLYDELLTCSTEYSELFDVLNKCDTERLRSLLTQNDCNVSSVLLTSALICFNKSLTDSVLKVVRHMCHRHALITLYPPGSTADADDEFECVNSKKGDAALPYQNTFTERLCRLLQQRTELTKIAVTENRQRYPESEQQY